MAGYDVVMVYTLIKAYTCNGKPIHFFTIPIRRKFPDYKYPEILYREILGVEGFFNYKYKRNVDRNNNIIYIKDSLYDSLDPLQPMYRERENNLSLIMRDLIDHMRYIPVTHLTSVSELFSIIGYDRKKKRFTSEPKYDTNIIEPKIKFNYYVENIGVPE